jgi:uncharacterized protein (DUF1800 family)
MVSSTCERLGEGIPEKVQLSGGPDIDLDFHFLSRAGFGPWPGALEYIKEIGRARWLDEQLHPETIDDKACDLRARRFESLAVDPGLAYEFKREALRSDMARHALLRAIYSRRQLQEVMVEFWSDHFNISIEKGECIYLKPTDDSKVIREHALGNFRKLLESSALSPAMLTYLDGRDNKKARVEDIPNENYARELLELHTMGVGGGYTQKDVFEVARALTGYRVQSRYHRGLSYFDRKLHDQGTKYVLGKVIPANGGPKDLGRVLDILMAQPGTAHYIATKLATRFVSDNPSELLVKEIAGIFSATGGDIKAMLKAIFESPEFLSARGLKIKRPFRYMVSTLRALAADTHAHKELLEYLGRMGQPLFQYPTPDGYSEQPEPWLGSMLWRWNFALACAANQIPSVNVQASRLFDALGLSKEGEAELAVLLTYFFGRAASGHELLVYRQYLQERKGKGTRHVELVGLILASPPFQCY